MRQTHNGDLKEAGDADEDIGSGGPNKWDLDMDVKNFTVAPDSSPDHEEDEEIVVLPVAPKEIENIGALGSFWLCGLRKYSYEFFARNKRGHFNKKKRQI